MTCRFCSSKIHFYEEFMTVGGDHFHIQILTLNQTLRCQRVHNRLMEAEEKKLTKKGA